MVAPEAEKHIAHLVRYLARRAVRLQGGSTAVKMINRALLTCWRIVLEEPTRTLLTLTAAYFLWILPKSAYHWIEEQALKVTSIIQRQRLRQDQLERAQVLGN